MKVGDIVYLADRYGEIVPFLEPDQSWDRLYYVRVKTWERDDRGKKRKISKLFPLNQIKGHQPNLF